MAQLITQLLPIFCLKKTLALSPGAVPGDRTGNSRQKTQSRKQFGVKLKGLVHL